MNRLILVAATIAVASPIALATPAAAQNRNYNREVRECNRELRRADTRAEYRQQLRECRRDLRRAQNQDWRRYNRYDYNRYEPGYQAYNAQRYYRDGSYYADRRVTRNERIYRGQNGQYYCHRSDGTTGLIIGGGLGALAGNQINLGGSQTVRTIIGGAAGAIIGREIDRGNMRCN
ncbi:MAG: glycine zipper 2TM domain-containing protein [Sphingomonas bacterium]|nr:glycine zipper 2TM domain-containing protein [Sphingomonas bacterium]